MTRRIPITSSVSQCFLAVGLGLLLVGCGPKEDNHSGQTTDKPETTVPQSHDDHHEGEAHSHAHTAPHGGTLVILGDHFAIIEIILDAVAGKMTAYVLDGEGEKPIRISQTSIEILILKPGSPAAGTPVGDPLKLDAVANALTGETVGDTSEFSITSDLLKGKEHFDGLIQSVTIKGEEKKGTSFKFPEGNE